MKIAVLVCSHNRREITRACLTDLATHDLSNIDVYVLDDASTDGTSEMICHDFPWVKLNHGDGSLFWNRAMAKAWEHAALLDYDCYIWLNDDVRVLPHWRSEMISCLDLTQGKAIISGIIQSQFGETIYGGSNNKGELLQSDGTLQPIRNLNGNLTLVPRAVFQAIGGLDIKFHHDLGDVEYGYRATLNGFSVLTSRTSVAIGQRNDICRVRKPFTSVQNRFKRLYSPLGCPPRISFYFRRKYFGLLNAAVYVMYLHAINLLPDAAIRAAFGDRYFPKS